MNTTRIVIIAAASVLSVFIILPALTYILDYKNQIQLEDAQKKQHEKECNQLKNTIDFESKKLINQILSGPLNNAVKIYNENCL